jgi:uncharacterized membrane protein HdeD (DUF308 family)
VNDTSIAVWPLFVGVVMLLGGSVQIAYAVRTKRVDVSWSGPPALAGSCIGILTLIGAVAAIPFGIFLIWVSLH